MTESWAPDPLTPEEEAEMAKYQDEASETDPPDIPQTGVDQDDPPQIDNRTAAERFMGEDGDEEPIVEADKKPDPEPEPEKPVDDLEAVKPAEEPKPPSQEISVDDGWSDEAKAAVSGANNTIRGLRGEIYRNKEKVRRNDQTVQDLRQQVQDIPQLIKDAIREATAAPPPDPDVDPDGYIQHVDADVKALRDAETQRQEDERTRVQQEREFTELDQAVIDQEQDYLEQAPDYWQAKQHAIEAGVKRLKTEQGLDDVTARQRANAFMTQEAINTRAMGGNVAHRFYYIAQNEYGWKQGQAALSPQNGTATPNGSGQSDAETIARGQAASKGLGKSGSGGKVGKRSQEEISRIQDPEEHAREYLKWEEEQIGES